MKTHILRFALGITLTVFATLGCSLTSLVSSAPKADVFIDNFSNCQLATPANASASTECANGEYTIKIKESDYGAWVTYSSEYSDAVIEVDVRSLVAEPFGIGGIVWRASSDNANLYVFLIAAGQRYAVYRVKSPDMIRLIPPTFSEAIKPGVAVNRLKVIAQGSQMAFYVNDQWLNTITDATLSKGQVGLYGSGGTPGAQVAFVNVRIQTITSPLVMPPSTATVATGLTSSVTTATATPIGTTLVFQDDFTQCILPEEQTTQYALGCHNGEYVMQNKKTNMRWVYYDTDYGDVLAQVHIDDHSVGAAGEFGMAFRMDSNGEKFVAFGITKQDEYTIFAYDNGKITDIVPLTKANLATRGLPTWELKVIAQGNQIAVYSDNQLLTSVVVPCPCRGKLGFYISTDQPEQIVAFSNLQIWQTNHPTTLPPGLPTSGPGATLTPVASDITLIMNEDFNSTCSLAPYESAQVAHKCEGGEYTILSKIANRAFWQMFKDEYADVIMEADARVLGNSPVKSYGLIIRGSSDNKNFYFFGLSNNGQYAILRYAHDDWITLVPYTSSNAIKQGAAVNRLKVIAQGTEFAFYVNGQWVHTIRDATLGNGLVGVYMASNGANAKAAFDNIQVWEINRPVPLPVSPSQMSSDTTLVFEDKNAPCLLPQERGAGLAFEFKCENGSYVMRNNTPRARWVYYDEQHTDFIVEVDAVDASGPPCCTDFFEYGLLFRVSSDGENFYGVSVTNNGKYDVFSYQNGKWSNFISYTPSAAVNPAGSPNKLRVYAQENQFAVYLNDYWLNTITDSRFNRGSVGFLLNQEDTNHTAVFSHLRIWQINRPISIPVGAPTPRR